MKVIFVIASILSIGLIIYGVLTHKKRVAKGDRGTLNEIKTISKTWIPITLILSDNFPKRNQLEKLVREAIRFWNHGVGLSLFNPLGGVGTGRVVPIMREMDDFDVTYCSTKHPEAFVPDFDDELAYTRLNVSKEGELKSAGVYLSVIWDSWDNEKVVMVLAHELGHVLGLAHDKHPSSVMYPIASRRQYSVSTKDKNLLRSTFS